MDSIALVYLPPSRKLLGVYFWCGGCDNEARRIAANMAKLPELLHKRGKATTGLAIGKFVGLAFVSTRRDGLSENSYPICELPLIVSAWYSKKSSREVKMQIFRLSLILLTAAALLAPITAEAKTSHMMSVQTPSGKTVELRTMKIHGQMMILVPMDMACDVFHVNCAGAPTSK